MIITEVMPYKKNLYKLYIDDEYVANFYTREIRTYELEKGKQIEQEELEKILQETVYLRVKKKAMALLEKMDRTEAELKKKLLQAEYSSTAIEIAVNYLKKYHYLDDKRYTEYFVQSKSGYKSKKEIEYLLRQKGISKEYAQEYMERFYEDEELTIKKLIKKKVTNPNELEEGKKQKLIASLCRKGFSYDKIRRVIQNWEEDLDE